MIRMWNAMEAKSSASWIMEGAMEVSITAAKKHLSELLRSVEKGEAIVVTQNGKPVAQLVPPLRASVSSGLARCVDAFT